MSYIFKPKVLIISLWIITFCWIAMIFLLSSQNGSQTANTSGGIAKTAARIIYTTPTNDQINNVHFDIRKLSHVGLFLVLGALLYASFKSTFILRGSKSFLFPFGLAIIMSSAYSVFDEWHKQFIPGRHFDTGETLINIISSFAGVVIVLGIMSFKKHMRNARS